MPDLLPPGPLAVLPSGRRWPLHGVAASRAIEHTALAGAPPHALMEFAGLSVARLAMAVAPMAGSVWVAAGPGNNGGDGLVAARWLRQWGRHVQVSQLTAPAALPADAGWALLQAQQAGVAIHQGLPGQPEQRAGDLAIDALLGLGARRPPQGALAEAIALLNAGAASVLAVDMPSGLHADTGALLGQQAVQATHTLSLLTLKLGLFTAQARDHAGRVWFDALGQTVTASHLPQAWLAGPPQRRQRRHDQHKGSFGDLLVVGGAVGMAGAALLAARAALAAGAGRVYLVRLDGAAAEADGLSPELMSRRLDQVLLPELLAQATVVCGCGGGQAVRQPLPALLHHAARLVLDADALNALAADPALRQALRARSRAGLATVLTPHPLEAARLLACGVAQVQADRLRAAQTLADDLGSTVLLKGSGTVVCHSGRPPCINPTGNARLGSAGSGDVLAGWIGGSWSATDQADGLEAAVGSAWLHGRAAEVDAAAQRAGLPLCASALIPAMVHAAALLSNLG